VRYALPYGTAPAHPDEGKRRGREGEFAMRKLIIRLACERRAQDLAEYGVALAIIGSGAAAVAIAFAGNVNAVWASANAAISNAADLIAGS
jgi:hypothetical protein